MHAMLMKMEYHIATPQKLLENTLINTPKKIQNEEFVEGEDYACYVDKNGVPHCDSPETLRKHFDKHTEKIQNEEFVEGEDSDTKDVDTKDSDTKDVDPKDSDTKDVDTKDSDSKDYD